jgi:hypothetical protein
MKCRLMNSLPIALWAAACGTGADGPSPSEVTCTPHALEAGEIFHEDWDGCIEGWMTREGEPVKTVADPTTPPAGRGKVEELTRIATDSASTMYSSWLSLVPMNTTGNHCMGAWVRWVSGNAPFLGIRRYDANQVDSGLDERLIGPGEGTCGGAVLCSSEPNAFRYYHQTFTATAGEFFQVLNGLDETVTVPGAALSYVDVISITEGACAADKPAISILGTLTAWATSPLGATLTYAASAADPTSGLPLPVTCSPASGTMFPMGTTKITCTAGSGASLVTKSVDAHVLTWGRGVRSALIVVPTSGATTLDQQVATRLRGLGLETTILAQTSITPALAAGRTVVLVMPGVDGATIKNSLRTVHSTVLVLEPTALDDLGMTGTAANVDFGTATSAYQTLIVQPTHPMAAGYGGLASVYASLGSLGWGRPGSTAVNVATVVGQANQATIFGYLTGSQMVGQVAPSRRAGLFLTRTVGDGITTIGWQFFDAAVKWLASPEVLFVVADSAALNASDLAMKNRLTWLGWNPVVISDETVTATDADGRMAVLVSGSVSASVLGAKLTNVRVPMVVLLPGLLAQLPHARRINLMMSQS